MLTGLQILAFAATLSASSPVYGPAIDARLPVIAADMHQDRIAIRFAGGLESHGPSMRMRSVVLEAYDASGKRVGETSLTLSARLTYANVELPTSMRAANRIVVSAR